MQVHIHPLATIYINTLLAWAKCFLATYGVYPGLYDLLDTPRRDFLAAQLHLRDSTLPRPLLHQSRGAPTIRSEYVAVQPHLAPPPHPIVCTSVARAVRPSPCQSVMRPVCPSSRQPPQSVSHPTSQLHCPSIPLTVHPSSPPVTVHPPSPHSVHDSSVRHPPSVLRNVSQTVHPCPTVCTPSVLWKVRQTVHHRPTVCTPSYHVCQTVLHCLTLHPPHQPVRPTIRNCPIVCTPPPPIRQTICHHHTICTTHQSVRQPVHHQHRHYDLSTRTSVIPHNSPYPRLKPIPSHHEWGAITHDSPYTRFEPIPSSHEWGAILQG